MTVLCSGKHFAGFASFLSPLVSLRSQVCCPSCCVSLHLPLCAPLACVRLPIAPPPFKFPLRIPPPRAFLTSRTSPLDAQ